MTIPSVFQAGFRLISGDALNKALANPLSSYVSGITATPSGTVTNSYLISNYFTEVDTVATSGDSVALPAAVQGQEFTIINNTANPMTVFAKSSSTINGVAGATGVLQAPGTIVTYSTAKKGAWFSTGAGTLSTVSIQVDTGTKTATASAGAATLNKNSGVITSEALVTAAGATYTLTITDSVITANDIVMASASLGTSTQGVPNVSSVKPGAGSLVITVQNIHASLAFNGTIKVAFVRFVQ